MVKQCRWQSVLAVLIIYFCLVGRLYAQSSQPSIKLSLDSSEIYLGDAIVLEVESTGLLDPIDFSPLQANTRVVRETGGTRIAVIKGKVVEIVIKRIDLIPAKPGLTVIGPLFAGDVSSNSGHVNVLNETRPTWLPAENDFQIQTTLTPDDPWVNQQTLFTIELLHRYPISNEEITLPLLSGFATRPLLENRRTFKDPEKMWYRTQWHYLIYPAQSGLLPIDEIQWSGTAIKSRSERAVFTRRHQAISVDVQPAAADTGLWWLPARNLTLNEQWSSPITALRAGDEVQRIISIRAQSILAGQIPKPAVPESRALQQTLINTTRNEEIINNTVVSTAEFTYRVKAQSPIPVFLDTVRLPWWNTEDNTAKEAIIPARRINVGLPDRADLLSTIALQESGITRFKHWLQSTSWMRGGVFIAAAIAFIVLACLFLPVVLSRLKHRMRINKQWRSMRDLAKRGDAKGLYEYLSRPDSRERMAGNDTEIINTLHQHLFSAPRTQHKALPLTEMVRTLQSAGLAQVNARTTNRHAQQALARL